jgi:hypothetical protein
MTLQKPILQNMQTKLIFLREDFHVSRSVVQEKEKAQKMNDTCGAKCYEQYKRLNPNMSLLKMSLVSQILMAGWYSTRCALTWKMKGMKFNRLLLVLQVKMHHTEDIDVGLSQFIPTPNAMDYNTGTKAETYEARKKHHAEKGVNLQMTLRQMAKLQMLPTPMNADWKGGKSKRKTNTQLTETLGVSSQLNPRFVGEMMGFPPNWTELPFQSGETNQSKDMETP